MNKYTILFIVSLCILTISIVFYFYEPVPPLSENSNEETDNLQQNEPVADPESDQTQISLGEFLKGLPGAFSLESFQPEENMGSAFVGGGYHTGTFISGLSFSQSEAVLEDYFSSLGTQPTKETEPDTTFYQFELEGILYKFSLNQNAEQISISIIYPE